MKAFKFYLSHHTSHLAFVKCRASGLSFLATFPTLYFSIKARALTRMTRPCPMLYHFYQQRVGIAVVEDFFDLLHVARGLAFFPVFQPRPGPEMSIAAFHCCFQGSLIHICHHQYFPIPGILNNSWNEPVGIIFKFR